MRQYSDLLRGVVEEAPPLIIAGGLGSGKTQLLYHIFKYSWRDLKIPVLYVNLRTVLSLIKHYMTVRGRTGRLTPMDFVSILLKLALKRVELIKDNFISGDLKLSDLWLPEITGQPANTPPSELFEKIGVAPNEAYDLINKTLERKRGIVVLIDEVEMAYNELKDLIEGGFRDLVDIIGRGTMGVYTVMAVSYLSYYELFLSEFTGDIAFARRIGIVQLPPIDPDVLYEKLKPRNMDDKSNTFWWFTRGRLGWITSLKDVVLVDDTSVGSLLEWVDAPQLRTPIAENLPVLDVDELLRLEDKHCRGNDECNAALRFFILNIRPLKVEDLPSFVKTHLDELSALLIHCSDLVSVAEAVDAFTSDIKEFCDREGIVLESGDLELIRRALNEILSALALRTGKDKLVCLGAPSIFLLNDKVYNYVDSIIDILMTYIAENYDTSERVKTVTETLYLVYSLALSRERWKGPRTFHEVKGLFGRHVGQNYVMVGSWVLRKLIPMYLSNPIISKEPGMTIEKLEQDLRSYLLSYAEHEIVDAITGISEYIAQQKGEALVYIVPLPRPHYINDQVREKAYSIVKELIQRRIHDIKYGSLHLAVFFAGGDIASIQYVRDKLRREDTLLSLLIEQAKRISLEQIPGERLSDFVKSLFVLLISEMSQTYGATIEGIVNTLKPDQRRRVEYFKTTLATWLDDSIERLRRKRETSLRINDLYSLSGDLIDDINVLDYVVKRTGKFRPHIRGHAAFFTMIGVRDPLDKIQLSLSPGGLIKVKALPSIYQEFSRRGSRCKSITKLLSIPVISDIVRVALEDKKDLPLEDALKILEEEELPLFNDFVEILEKSVGIRYSDYSTVIRLLYRVLLLNMLLSLRKDDVVTLLLEKASAVKEIGHRLKELLEDIERISNDICRGLPLCIKITVRPRDRSHTLEDETRGILSALDIVEKWAEDLKSGRDIGYDKFLSLAYMAVFGLPEEGDMFLVQIQDILKKWYDGLHDKVYKQISSLQQKLRQLPMGVGSSRRIIKIVIGSLNDLDNANRKISEILNEVDTVVREYDEALKKIEEAKRSLQAVLENVLEKIDRVEREV